MRPAGPAPDPPSAPQARPRDRRRTWLPVVAVSAVLFVVVFGGEITQAALSTEVGPQVGVAGVVSVRPLSGWRVAGRSHVAGIPDLRITRGNGNLDVLVSPFDGGEKALVLAYLHQIVAPQARQLRVSATFEEVPVGRGLTGVGVRYIGLFGDRATPIEGEVTGAVAHGNGVVFDGWAPSGLFQYVQSDLHTMIANARFA
jgi:hypothetical protein